MALIPFLEAGDPSEQRTNRRLAIIDLVLLVTLACILHRILPLSNLDIAVYYLPWYQHIVHYGRWASREGSYANYTPPYLYLLSAFTLLNGLVAPEVIIKLVQVPGMIAAGLLGWKMARLVGASQQRACLAGLLVVLAPEVVANALDWGQSDTLYTAVLFAMTALLLANRQNWAMAAFGVALAVKLQAIFAGPTVAALLLTGEVPLLSALWIPVAFVAMMVPAWLAGRPAVGLLTIYANQASTYPDIGMNVANGYQVLTHWSRSRPGSASIINSLGLLVALLVTVAMVVFLVRRRELLRGRYLIAAVALPLLVEPYVLPKMHDRYYFAGNTVLMLLAALDGRFAIPAVLTQIAAITVYHRFFDNGKFNPSYYIIPTLLVTVAIVLFLRAAFGRPERAGEAAESKREQDSVLPPHTTVSR